MGQVLATNRQCTIAKCSVISIHHKSKFAVFHPYFINRSQLAQSTSVYRFWYAVDSRLTCRLHVSNILTKATQGAGTFYPWICIT